MTETLPPGQPPQPSPPLSSPPSPPPLAESAAVPPGYGGPSAMPPPPPPEPKKSFISPRIQRIVYIVLAVVMGGIAILKFVTRNDLPGCDTTKTRDVLSTIFKSKNLEVKRYDDTTTISKTDDLITCNSTLRMPDDSQLGIDFTVARIPDDKFQVTITKATAK